MKIVFVVSRFPYPLEKGDKLRAFQHLKILSADHDVHLIALSDLHVTAESFDKVKGFCKSVNVFQLSLVQRIFNLLNSFLLRLPLQVGYFYSGNIREKIENRIHEIKPDVVYCQLIRTTEYVKNINSTPKIIDYQDAFSLGTYQRMLTAPWFLKPIFKREYALVKKYETKSFQLFERHFIISEQDRKALQVKEPMKVLIVPNGVDISFFKPIEQSKTFDVTFVGNMNYPPNVDSSLFLVNEIMPHVWKKNPDVKVQIAGANPNSKVMNLKSERVDVTGWVEDIRNSYAQSKIFIAPMRIGTGLQNKLLEAMSMKIPSITTSLSFGPLGATKDEHILVGDTAQELANHILDLLENSAKAEKLAKSGYDFVRSRFDLANISGKLLSEFDSLQKKV